MHRNLTDISSVLNLCVSFLSFWNGEHTHTTYSPDQWDGYPTKHSSLLTLFLKRYPPCSTLNKMQVTWFSEMLVPPMKPDSITSFALTGPRSRCHAPWQIPSESTTLNESWRRPTFVQRRWFTFGDSPQITRINKQQVLLIWLFNFVSYFLIVVFKRRDDQTQLVLDLLRNKNVCGM